MVISHCQTSRAATSAIKDCFTLNILAMEKHFDWVQSSVIEDIDVTFSTTFCPAKDSHLQLHRSPKVEGGNVTDLDKCAILPVTVTTQTDLEEAEVSI